MKRILIVAVAVAAILPTIALASEPVPFTIYLDKKGWSVNKTHGLTAEKAAECRGRLVVDTTQCKRIPPQRHGGPWGLRCPNKCVEK